MTRANPTTTDKTKISDEPRLVERVIFEGDFVLQSAAHFGSGKSGEVDMTLIRDGYGDIIIPGASIAGACRSYLAYYLLGSEAFDFVQAKADLKSDQFEAAQKDRVLRNREQETAISRLFGDTEPQRPSSNSENGQNNPESPPIFQSALLVSDAYAVKDCEINRRDGVKIDAETGQAKDAAKYDYEVVERETIFKLRFELVIRHAYADQAQQLKKLMAIILAAFRQGSISLGAKTRRGLGRGIVSNWKVTELDLTQPKGIFNWLSLYCVKEPNGDNWIDQFDLGESKQNYFEIKAGFKLTSSLIIRTYAEQEGSPDSIHIKSRDKPVLPGTSAAGVIRTRAGQIINTLDGKADNWLKTLFGDVKEKKKDGADYQRASRFLVEEVLIENTVSEIQSRIKIDRFTGGVIDGGLFDEAPLWAEANAEGANWFLSCRILEPDPAEIGLLLLILKDMWVGDLPFGGGANIGRGILSGVSATLTYRKSEGTTPTETWKLTTDPNHKEAIILEPNDPQSLENFVIAFNHEVRKSANGNQ